MKTFYLILLLVTSMLSYIYAFWRGFWYGEFAEATFFLILALWLDHRCNQTIDE